MHGSPSRSRHDRRPRTGLLSRAVAPLALAALAAQGCGESVPPAPSPAPVRLSQDERAAITEEVRQAVRKDLRESLRDELRRELRETLAAEVAALGRTAGPGARPQPAGATSDGRPSVVATPPAEDERPGTTLSQASGPVRLIELAVGTNVVDRNPEDVRERYAEVPPMLYCYSAVESREPNQAIVHVWRRQGVLVSRVELEVGKSPRWKTWSKQKTQAHWTGPWSCEVTSADGEQLGVTRFVIGP